MVVASSPVTVGEGVDINAISTFALSAAHKTYFSSLTVASLTPSTWQVRNSGSGGTSGGVGGVGGSTGGVGGVTSTVCSNPNFSTGLLFFSTVSLGARVVR